MICQTKLIRKIVSQASLGGGAVFWRTLLFASRNISFKTYALHSEDCLSIQRWLLRFREQSTPLHSFRVNLPYFAYLSRARKSVVSTSTQAAHLTTPQTTTGHKKAATFSCAPLNQCRCFMLGSRATRSDSLRCDYLKALVSQYCPSQSVSTPEMYPK